jgi:hypothetical protein
VDVTLVPLAQEDTVELQGTFRAADGYFAADQTTFWAARSDRNLHAWRGTPPARLAAMSKPGTGASASAQTEEDATLGAPVIRCRREITPPSSRSAFARRRK